MEAVTASDRNIYNTICYPPSAAILEYHHNSSASSIHRKTDASQPSILVLLQVTFTTAAMKYTIILSALAALAAAAPTLSPRNENVYATFYNDDACTQVGSDTHRIMGAANQGNSRVPARLSTSTTRAA
jgi:hypothetical protein